ncbi:MAG: hypothetical protein V3S20_06960 [Dehalococcoidia bacterium]
MTLHNTHGIDSNPDAAHESWQAFFFAGEYDADTTVENRLDAWTTGDLLTEVLDRSADDAPALRLLQHKTLQAFLVARDRESARSRADVQHG